MRYTGSRGKKVRRLGQAFTEKEARILDRRPAPPGVHGKGKGRPSEFATQLREKQRMKYAYGVTEKQFYRMFLAAQKKPGSAGQNLLRDLELRLDNVVYRLGFATTRRQARQMVSHGFFTVNGTTATTASIALKTGDAIAVKESKKTSELYKAFHDRLQGYTAPDWLSLSAKDATGKVLAAPDPKQHAEPLDSKQVVEHYQRI